MGGNVVRPVVWLVLAAAVTASCGGPERVDSLAVPVHPTTESSSADPSDDASDDPSVEPMGPVDFEERTWTWDGGIDVVAEVPHDWTQVDRGPGWWDLHDPTDQVVLRIQVVAGGPPATVASEELQRLAPAAGFELFDQRLLEQPSDGWESGYEIHYGYDRSGSAREATLRYLGTLDVTFGAVAVLTPPELHDDASDVLDHVASSMRWVG